MHDELGGLPDGGAGRGDCPRRCDPGDRGREGVHPHRGGVWDEVAQAESAERFYRVGFGHPAVVAITWWDLCDEGSWLEGGGLLRKGLGPKPAYDALSRLIHQEWRTRAEGRTDRDGAFGFRGFRGTYRVTVELGGKKKEATFELGADEVEAWRVDLDS